MAYNRDSVSELHKDYQETVTNWQYYIRSYNGGYDYMIGQYLNRYNLELDNEKRIFLKQQFRKLL